MRRKMKRKMKQTLKSHLEKALELVNAFPTRMTDKEDIKSLLKRLYPLSTDKGLIRPGTSDRIMTRHLSASNRDPVRCCKSSQ